MVVTQTIIFIRKNKSFVCLFCWVTSERVFFLVLCVPVHPEGKGSERTQKKCEKEKDNNNKKEPLNSQLLNERYVGRTET
jgi:hypothetical protein